MGIQNVLKLFYTYSGLQLNCAKSEMYFTGISRGDVEAIQQATWFKLSTLPVRYWEFLLLQKGLMQEIVQ